MAAITNLTQTSSHPPTYNAQIWIFSQVVTAVLVIATAWFFAAFVSYGRRNSNKWNLPRNPHKYNNKFVLLLLATVSTGGLMVRLLVTQALIVVERTASDQTWGNNACEVAIDMSVILFSATTMPAYFFFWCRQNFLYSQPLLDHLRTRTVRFLNYLFLFILFTGGASSAFINTIPRSYRISLAPHRGGCVQREDAPKNYAANYITVTTLILVQLILLGLFCHPLLYYKKMQEQATLVNSSFASAGDATATATLPQNRANNVERLYKTMRRAFVSMFICVTSDALAAFLIAKTLNAADTPQSLTRVVYDVSLFMNIVAMTLGFEDTRGVFLGMCRARSSLIVTS